MTVVTASNPEAVAAAIGEGLAHHRAGRLPQAEAAYRRVLAAEPTNPDALHLLGVIAHQEGNNELAVDLIGRAIAANSSSPDYYNNLGLALHEQGKQEAAVAAYHGALELKLGFAEAHNNLGNALHEQGKLEEAVAAYRRALELKPDYAEAHYNLGNTLKDQDRLEDAVAAYRRVLKLKPDDAGTHNNLGIALQEQGRLVEAVAAYRGALELKPGYAEAHYNLGIALKDQGRLEDAVAACLRALELKPDYAEAHNNLGNALKDQGGLEDAVAAYRGALELNPGFVEAHNNLGLALHELGRPEEAVAAYRGALELKPGYAEVQGGLVHVLQHICDWDNLQAESEKLDELVDVALREGRSPGETPFTSVTRCDDLARNLAIAKSWSANIEKKISSLRDQLPADFTKSPRSKINLGYLSADFRAHATAHLMGSLFGLHDRNRFTITAYSYGSDDGSEYRARIENDCDAFVEIRDLSAMDAARRIREDGIDILVDLKGHTREARLEICALRPAPVQVTYLGFPGTTGADFFDYVITDRTVTPEDHAPYYTEKFAYLPDCYQVNDHTQAISHKPYTRAEFGLPEDGFVFCSFNNSYKIEPVMWDVWMRIMRHVDGGILWLLHNNDPATHNLEREAAARDVDPRRIVFAGRLPKAEHLARIKLADLFLDTRICGAHTTGSDALWVGVPLIAFQGKHFASRVGSSLLAAIGLPELIAKSLEEYEKLAIRLAGDSGALATIRNKLSHNHLTDPLFDTPRFARNLENAYAQMWEAHLSGRHPRIINVSETHARSLGNAGKHAGQDGKL